MHTSRVVELVFALGVLAACGPSTKDVQEAKAARYDAEVGTIFEIALDAARESFKIYDDNFVEGRFVTMPRWYSQDGQSQSAGVGDVVKVDDGSLNVALLVQVARDGMKIAVTVTPVVERFRLGQSQHDKLAPDDPSMPGWVNGKAEALLVAIHNRAKQYAVGP